MTTIDFSTVPQLSLHALLEQAGQLSQAGRHDLAAGAYEAWLAHNDSPDAHLLLFNLGVERGAHGDLAGAIAAYRGAIERRKTYAPAWFNLGLLEQASGQVEQTLSTWSTMLGVIDRDADQEHYVRALNQLGWTLAKLERLEAARGMFGRSLERDPSQADIAYAWEDLSRRTGALGPRLCDPANDTVPMVSILIPTHNRPDYAELALKSVLAQTWRNIEIVISDNSDDELTAQRFAPYAAANSCIRYLRIPSCGVLDNFRNCLANARGEFINFLMDDDLFHPNKIAAMMAPMLAQPSVALVTSFRQLIDDHGKPLPPGPATARLLDAPALIGGAAMTRHVLVSGLNVIGEPTTVLFRRKALQGAFGELYGQAYQVITDMSAWLSILARHDCVYLPEALSFFRIHGNQDQRRSITQIRGMIENLRLLCDVYRHTPAVFDGADVHGLLAGRLTQFLAQIAQWHAEVRQYGIDPERIHALVRTATELLLDPPAQPGVTSG
jgi:glycosyltransferase involved in cell wall biosynthesis